MQLNRFAIACLALAVTAITLLAVSASSFAGEFAEVGESYGRGVLILVGLLIPVQFACAVIYRVFQDRGKNVSQDEKMASYKAYFLHYPWINVLCATAGLIVTLTSFTIYKSKVVGANGYGFDALFIAWDRMIFAGNDPWVLTHAVFNTPSATAFLDTLYHPTFLPMLLLYLLAITVTGLKELRQTYMLSYLAGWVVIGMIGASTLHSAGPIYDGMLYGDGTTFGPLQDRLAAQLAAGGGPVSAAGLQEYLFTLHETGETRFGGGISAMPSMHMVLVFLWVFPAWHINRLFGCVVTAYAILIWIGSVHLGWHYFVDGLVSLVLIGVIWIAAGRYVGLYRKTQVTRATT